MLVNHCGGTNPALEQQYGKVVIKFEQVPVEIVTLLFFSLFSQEWPIMNEIFTEEESDDSDGNNEVIKPM